MAGKFIGKPLLSIIQLVQFTCKQPSSPLFIANVELRFDS